MKGLKEFAIQRLTAIYMAIYIMLAVGFFAAHNDLQYQQWHHFFSVLWVQLASLIFLVCLLWHAWIGILTVLTDYVKIAFLQITLQVLVILALLIFFFWGVQIVWGLPFNFWF